jgi:hypothetical protein
MSNVAYTTSTEATMLPFAISSSRDPTTSDLIDPDGTPYRVGRGWVNTTTLTFWTYVSGSTVWQLQATASGALNTLTGDTGTATASSNNIKIAGTANQIVSTASGATVTESLSPTLVAPGFLTATTFLTATLGDVTATNGNIVRGTAGNKDVYSSVATTTTAGANSAGTVTLSSGTATVATTAVTAASQIRLYRQGIGATGAAALGILTLGTISAGVSFVITAVQAADATAAQASDVSVIGWEIVN